MSFGPDACRVLATSFVPLLCALMLLPSTTLADTIWIPPAAHAKGVSPVELATYQDRVISWMRERGAGATYRTDALPTCDDANGRICVVKALREQGADIEIETWFFETAAPRSIVAHVSIITRDDFIYRHEGRAATYEEALQVGLVAAWQDFERGPGPWLNVYGPEPGKEVRLGGTRLCELPCLARVQPGEHVVTLHDNAGMEIAQVRTRASVWGFPRDVLIGSDRALKRWNGRRSALLVSAPPSDQEIPHVTVPKEPIYALEDLSPSTPLPPEEYPLAWLDVPEPAPPIPVTTNVTAAGPTRASAEATPERRGGAWHIGPALLTTVGVFGVTVGLRTFFMGARCTLHAPPEVGGGCVEYTAPRHGVGAAWLTVGSLALLGGVTWWVVGSRPRRTTSALAIGPGTAAFVSTF